MSGAFGTKPGRRPCPTEKSTTVEIKDVKKKFKYERMEQSFYSLILLDRFEPCVDTFS